MNDLEQKVRDTLLRHQGDAPLLEIADVRRVARQAHRRQVRNLVVGGIAGAAVVIGGIAGFDGLLRVDGPPTGSDPPSPSRMCVATETAPGDVEVHGWPGPSRNPAGVYSWDNFPDPDVFAEGFIHNAYSPGSGDVTILIEGVQGRLIPHRGQTAVTVARCEGTYRRFIGDPGRLAGITERGPVEEWMVDIQGTTVTISLAANPGAPEAEVAEAHQIIESIRSEPQDSVLGFRLIFTLKTNTWDSG
jgi:hypothetical protein